MPEFQMPDKQIVRFDLFWILTKSVYLLYIYVQYINTF